MNIYLSWFVYIGPEKPQFSSFLVGGGGGGRLGRGEDVGESLHVYMFTCLFGCEVIIKNEALSSEIGAIILYPTKVDSIFVLILWAFQFHLNEVRIGKCEEYVIRK